MTENAKYNSIITEKHIVDFDVKIEENIVEWDIILSLKTNRDGQEGKEFLAKYPEIRGNISDYLFNISAWLQQKGADIPLFKLRSLIEDTKLKNHLY
jgi:hypothetical protein